MGIMDLAAHQLATVIAGGEQGFSVVADDTVIAGARYGVDTVIVQTRQGAMVVKIHSHDTAEEAQSCLDAMAAEASGQGSNPLADLLQRLAGMSGPVDMATLSNLPPVV